LIAIFKACPASQIQLVGHTDNTGDAIANQALSERRSVAIKELLSAAGIA
jgi:OOP family OmpA-OmpF porin